MGMQAALSRRWLGLNAAYLNAIGRAADVIGLCGSLSRTMRLMLQSALGVGAYLVIQHELMPGAADRASITIARALAPIEAAIANWRGFVAARDSVGRLTRALATFGAGLHREHRCQNHTRPWRRKTSRSCPPMAGPLPSTM